MSRRPARVTEVEIRRAIAAARKEGARAVELYGGAAVIRLDAPPATAPNQTPDDTLIL
jgi:hypothetical protein